MFASSSTTRIRGLIPPSFPETPCPRPRSSGLTILIAPRPSGSRQLFASPTPALGTGGRSPRCATKDLADLVEARAPMDQLAVRPDQEITRHGADRIAFEH